MTTGSLTTTQPPNTPVCQTSEHTLNLIHPSMECTFITIAILRLFIILLLSCFCFHFDLRRYFILLPFCLIGPSPSVQLAQNWKSLWSLFALLLGYQ